MARRQLLIIGGAMSPALLPACTYRIQPYCKPRIVLTHIEHAKPLYQYILECGLDIRKPIQAKEQP